ncbi:D-glycero-alpha-D-manno-heptose-1,7-bisphosphate 7-phosphatase [Tumebacillus permanentifrigoris]|uniref:D,D-heptose 1,7-bisphosphate phosphatase n=1 Tax=Tumebacillus permanentifrigoris TaxID=378543 RepID=A0A316DCQ3_9BACL|nr:HAD family hydrolase [Tumebacillus permanentifrigoris]PWK15991.1 D-glycero-D-manno-heptose 1,7-bisphosphate phosphatase [Tumebacillus permanentifrigoris]
MSQPAVFLDRDGVINDHVRYVNTPEDLILFPGVGPAIRSLREAGYRVFVVTNQGGIGLGHMKEESLHLIHEQMERELERDGATLDEIAYCPHKPHARCACRKPEPKMILDLAAKYDIDLSKSYMVGDRETDIESGQKAGTQTIFIGAKGESDPRATFSAKTLVDAVAFILQART